MTQPIIVYRFPIYQYRRGLDDILDLPVGGIPMPTVVSVTLAVGQGYRYPYHRPYRIGWCHYPML